MKSLFLFIFLSIATMGVSQSSSRIEHKYSLNWTQQYSFGVPVTGMSFIMESNLASYQNHLFVGMDGNVVYETKMALLCFNTKHLRVFVYPFYLRYVVTDGERVTPVGLSVVKVFGDKTLNLGLDYWRDDTRKDSSLGKNRFTANISFNWTVFGERWQK